MIKRYPKDPERSARKKKKKHPKDPCSERQQGLSWPREQANTKSDKHLLPSMTTRLRGAAQT